MKILVAAAIAATASAVSLLVFLSIVYSIGAFLWFLKSGDWVWLTAMDMKFLMPYVVMSHTEVLSQSWIGLADTILWVARLPIIFSGPIALWLIVFLAFPILILILNFWDWLGDGKTDDYKGRW